MINTTTPGNQVPPVLPMSRWANGRLAKYLYWLGRLISIATFGHGKLQIYFFCAQPIGQGAYAAVRDDPNTVITPTLLDNTLVAQFPRPPQVLPNAMRAVHAAIQSL